MVKEVEHGGCSDMSKDYEIGDPAFEGSGAVDHVIQ